MCKQAIRLTVLVDNAYAEGLCSEWGLSVLVRTPGTVVLLDFGQTDAFARNARELGVSLQDVDCAVLSHAHYDHADGMGAFFERNDHAPLFLSSACGERCWSTKGGTAEPHYIGIRPGLLSRWSDRLRAVSTDRARTIAPGVHVVPHTTRGLAEEGRRAGMWLRDGDAWIPDDYAHEHSLVIELGQEPDAGLLVLNSCSHAGLGSILTEVVAALPGRRVDTFVGGLHLMHASDTDVLKAARVVREAGIRQVWTGHCTGEHAIGLLSSELPGRIHVLRPGLTFEVGTFPQLGLSCDLPPRAKLRIVD